MKTNELEADKVSESKIEEVITALWVIVCVLLWANDAPRWLVYAAGLKAALDAICMIVYAIKEIREEEYNQPKTK